MKQKFCKDCGLVLIESTTHKEYQDFCLKKAEEELLELRKKVAKADSNVKYWEKATKEKKK